MDCEIGLTIEIIIFKRKKDKYLKGILTSKFKVKLCKKKKKKKKKEANTNSNYHLLEFSILHLPIKMYKIPKG